MKTRWILSLLFLSAGLSSHPSIATDASLDQLQQRALDEYIVALGQMNGEELDLVEQLRALASSNPQFGRSEAIYREAQGHWKQFSTKDCDFLAAGAAGPAYDVKSMTCLKTYTQVRTEQLHGYAVALRLASKAPGMNAPIAPTYDCKFTDVELASASTEDACMIRTVAERCGNEGDVCLVRCLAVGGSKNIGGCYHLCRRYGLRGTPWSRPDKSAACSK